jgi:hypothetical protein
MSDDLARVGTPLDDVNDGFHESYDQARAEAKLDAPVFVICADVLTVFRGKKRQDHPFSPRIFHVIKSVAHAPVALFAAFQRERPDPRRVSALVEHVQRSLGALEGEHAAAEETLADLRAVLSSTLTFAERAAAERPSAAALDAFAKEQGPLLLRLTEAATRVELKALDACVEKALDELGADDRAGLQVVVTGDHQARNRSLGMQYFQKRLGEEPGAEERVTYGEGVEDADEAHALVGTRRLDNAVAQAFFGDPKRLQRDVLGDAVHALLAESELSLIR